MSEQENKNLDNSDTGFRQRVNDYKELHRDVKNDLHEQRKQRLQGARMSDGKTQFAGDAGKYAAKKLASSLGNPQVAAARIGWDLFKKVEWSMDWMILFPFLLAIIKDILDWVGFSLPVINEALNLSIGGLTAIILAVLSASAKKSGFGRKTVRKFVVLLAGIAAEELFGLNFFPIESITVAVCFILLLLERVIENEQTKEAGREEPEGGLA